MSYQKEKIVKMWEKGMMSSADFVNEIRIITKMKKNIDGKIC